MKMKFALFLACSVSGCQLHPACLIEKCLDPIAPTNTVEDVAIVRAEVDRLSALEAPEIYPTGSATLNGHVTGDFDVFEDPTAGFVGDLNLTVDFDQSENNVAGDITNLTFLGTNFDLYEQDTVVQDFRGELLVNGDLRNGFLDAQASGELTIIQAAAGYNYTLTHSGNFDLFLRGQLVEDAGKPALAGSLTGRSDSDELDLDVKNASFYATTIPVE